MADRDRTLDKIRALLATSMEGRGATEAERLTAAALAQRLMLKHRVEEYELALRAGRVALPGIESRAGGDYKQGSMWIVDIMGAVGGPMTVDVIQDRYVGGNRITLVGRPEAIAYVQLVTNWIHPQLTRYCLAALDEERTGALGAGLQWSWGETIRFKRSFYHGATRRLANRLREAFDEEEVGQALVLSDRKAVDDYYDLAGMKIRTQPITIAEVDASAARAGASAANRVDVDPRNKVPAPGHTQLTA